MALPLLTLTRRFASLVVLAAAFTLQSCSKLENGVVNEIEFPARDPRLAVTMFVSPGDTVLFATVYQSAGIQESTGSTPLRETTLTMSQNGTTLVSGDATNWNDDGPWGPPGTEQSVMKMVLDEPLELAEGDVSLTVDASPTFDPIVVTETVPETPVVAHLFEPRADTISEWGYSYYNHRITVGLDNRPGVRDDYMIYLEVKDEFGGGLEWYSTGGPAFPDPRVEYNGGCDCLLATDGGEDNVSLQTMVFEAWGGDDSGYDYEQTLRLRVERPTASLANHFRSVDAYYNALGNPFAEPASIQGNIPDGFGIFGVTNGVTIPLQD
jgi:hypothetical protein